MQVGTPHREPRARHRRSPLPSRRAAVPSIAAASRLLAATILVWLAFGGALALATEEAGERGGKESVVATAGRLAGDAERTRFALDLSAAPETGVFALADPYRIVIDLGDVAFDLPAGTGTEARGLVKGWRFGEIARGKARIVLDLTGPVSVDSTVWLPPAGEEPGRLVVDLVPSDAESFAETVRAGRPEHAGDGEGAAEADLDIPTSGKPVVVLDPGHGGIDPGARGRSGALEKDITLAFALELRAALEKNGRVEVRLTRGDDRFLSLAQRVRIARAFSADLFISIHADTAPQGFVRGATVYTLSERASDAQAAALAARENLADTLSGLDVEEPPDEVADILVELARRETKAFSTRFAAVLLEHLGTAVRLIGSNPHRYARFRVLRAPDVPSVLLELGYMSNAHDDTLLQSEAWRERAVGAVVAAIEGFFGNRLARSATGAD